MVSVSSSEGDMSGNHVGALVVGGHFVGILPPAKHVETGGYSCVLSSAVSKTLGHEDYTP